VALDVDRGLVTRDGAGRYGVIVDDAGKVNQPETDKLRKRMAGLRTGKPGIFNRGGTIEELKSRCLAETGLEPPATPQFRRVRGG
jgi:N-methylhydantoinase B